ncbi:MAG TPA: pirin family protein [Mycobacterium sp.]|nr:pirin family protein [Mycobacterium sp.]
MPAITVDTLTVPRVSAPAPADTVRPVRSITTGPRGVEGEGFPVVRAFGGVSAADLDPFVHMDQMGEVDYEPGEPRGTDWHPHRGFETVTYMIDGRFAHQDSHGGGGLITDGATQWMTAGSGILHIETPPAELVESGGLFHGIQLWVNLPRADKFATPRYQAIEGGEVTLLSSGDGGALVRVIAGDVGRYGGPGVTHTPITLAHATIAPGAQLDIPWNREFNALVYVLSGRGSVGAVGHPIGGGQLAVLGPGDRIVVSADGGQDSNRPAMEVLLLGGKPIREPVFHYGPFVMNTKSEVAQAIMDFNSGRFGNIPADALRPHRVEST